MTMHQISNQRGSLIKTLFCHVGRLTALLALALLNSPAAAASPAEISFADTGQRLGNSNKSWDVKLVDIDGNGVLDAYFEGTIWANNGQGSFTKGTLSFGPDNQQAYFADFNGDGFVDVLCNKLIHLNDRHYRFAQTKAVPCDIEMIGVFLADLNNDGAIDIIASAQSEDRILLNDGKGKFRNTRRSLRGWAECRYAIGDINGDGITDIYVAIPHGLPPNAVHTPNLIWLGDGKGGFTSRPHDIPGSISTCVALADFNGDGSPDLFVGNQGDSRVSARLFFNDGKGNFADSGQDFGMGINDAKAFDFNDDGHLDLILARSGSGETDRPVAIWINNGRGHFTDSGLRLGSASARNGFGETGGPITIWVNDGRDRFTDRGLRLGNAITFRVELGDLNGDGKTDVIASHVVKLLSTSFTDVWLNTSATAGRHDSLPKSASVPHPTKPGG
jgi:hypothetical protein